MHKKLATLKKTLPAFPPKKLFGNLKPEFVRKRLIDLQNYFRKVVKVGEVCQSRVFRDFISCGKQMKRTGYEGNTSLELANALGSAFSG
jgi:hypothetical protein